MIMHSTNADDINKPKSTHHVELGAGDHSIVYHRPGSQWVIQAFRPTTPLTVSRVVFEFDYLRDAYASMPDLVVPQRLVRADENTPLRDALLVKRFIDVDPAKNLLNLTPRLLDEQELLQLAQFVTITRDLLATPLTGTVPKAGLPRLPDIIDPAFRNLAFDRTRRLRLVDTNFLISTAHLYDLTCHPLDLDRRRIHRLLFTRLLRLENLLGRTRADLVADPLYRGYLTTDQINNLLRQVCSVPT